MRGSVSGPSSAGWIAIVAAVALALRLIVVLYTRDAVLFADMQEYHQRALHLLHTGTLAPDAFRVPLYSLFIAAILSVAGQQLIAVRIAQAVLGAVTVVLTFVLARRVTSERGARAAALIVAIYPALVLYSAYLMAETLFTALAILGMTLWTRAGPGAALAAGIAVGAATLTRSTGLAVLGGILLAEAWTLAARRRLDRGLLTRAALLGIGFLIALAPWIQRNYAIYQRFVPTDTSSGFNALLGNYPGATGRHPGIPAVDAAAAEYWGNARNDVERSDIGMRVAREFVMAEPGRAARLALLKVGYFFGVEGREHAWGYSFHVQGRHAPATVWSWGIAIVASFPVLMTFASIGALRPGLTSSSAGPLLVATLACAAAIHVASFGDSRFHLPWVPILAILAARAFAPMQASGWTIPRQLMLAVWLLSWTLVWRGQAAEPLDVLPQLAASPVPLRLPY